MAQIRIDSILGGHSQISNFAAKDQFQTSVGIDPSQAAISNDTRASGFIVPTASQTAASVTGAPLWMVSNPKNRNIYVSTSIGSTYTLDPSTDTVTGLSDGGNEAGTGSGNGAAYYDNYMYFAKNTTIARYGPLNGSPSFDGDYWGTTLSKAALVNTTYPALVQALSSLLIPNHILHRHSDGKLYIADVVGNQGTIHYIATKKTTVEGDTNDGSTASKLTFGYGLWPTAIETYGSNLAIALYEGSNEAFRQSVAKLAFWDTTSTNFNSILWVEFPDSLITAMKNVDGILYIASTNVQTQGYRITRYVGGSSVQEVAYFENAFAPWPGGMDGTAQRLLFGAVNSDTNTTNYASVYSIGLQKAGVSKGIFNILNLPGTITTAIQIPGKNNFPKYSPFAGTWDNSNGKIITSNDNTNYSESPSLWWSQVYKIGQPFEIKRIRIPLPGGIAANAVIIPKLYFDDKKTSQVLTTINQTNFPTTGPGAGIIANIKTAGDGSNIIRGYQNFFLELSWSQTNAFQAVGLPILIDFEIIPD